MKKILLIIGLLLFFIGQADSLAFDIPFDQDNGHVAIDESPDIRGEGSDKGTQKIAGAFMMATKYIRNILAFMAVLWIVWAGMQMVTAGGNDEQIDKGKKGITWALIGLCIVMLLEPLVKDVLYGGGSIEPGKVLDGNIQNSINTGKTEILAFLKWMEAILVVIAVAYIVISGIKMILALGDQEGTGKQKKALLWIAIGFIVILMNEVVIDKIFYKAILGGDGEVVFSTNSTKGVGEFIGIIKYFLQFLALLAFVVFIYGGFLMILSYGNDEQSEKGKKIIFSAIIGIVIIVISYALTATLLSGSA